MRWIELIIAGRINIIHIQSLQYIFPVSSMTFVRHFTLGSIRAFDVEFMHDLVPGPDVRAVRSNENIAVSSAIISPHEVQAGLTVCWNIVDQPFEMMHPEPVCVY